METQILTEHFFSKPKSSNTRGIAIEMYIVYGNSIAAPSVCLKAAAMEFPSGPSLASAFSA